VIEEGRVVEQTPAEVAAGTEIAGTETAPGASPGGNSRAANGMHSWVRDLVVSVAISAFIIIFLYQPVRVEGTSMLPMLEDQDRLFINKIAYRVGEIHLGDVVVFQYPRDHTKSYIKRVIALPGDALRIDRGRVYVNGRRLQEPYVPNRFSDDRSQPEMVLPAHEYFVMGDHRSISSDSRDFGPVDRNLIYGKAVFVYWPMEQVGVVR
jgi:signal peptidase I